MEVYKEDTREPKREFNQEKGESKINSLLSVWVMHGRYLRGGNKTET